MKFTLHPCISIIECWKDSCRVQGVTFDNALLNCAFDAVVMRGECVPDSWIGEVPTDPLGAYFLPLNFCQADAMRVHVVRNDVPQVREMRTSRNGEFRLDDVVERNCAIEVLHNTTRQPLQLVGQKFSNSIKLF